MSDNAATLAAAFLGAVLALVGQWLFTRGERSEQRRTQRRSEFLPAVSRALTAAHDMYWLAWDDILNSPSGTGAGEERAHRQARQEVLDAGRKEATQCFTIAEIELEMVQGLFKVGVTAWCPADTPVMG